MKSDEEMISTFVSEGDADGFKLWSQTRHELNNKAILMRQMAWFSAPIQKKSVVEYILGRGEAGLIFLNRAFKEKEEFNRWTRTMAGSGVGTILRYNRPNHRRIGSLGDERSLAKFVKWELEELQPKIGKMRPVQALIDVQTYVNADFYKHLKQDLAALGPFELTTEIKLKLIRMSQSKALPHVILTDMRAEGVAVFKTTEFVESVQRFPVLLLKDWSYYMDEVEHEEMIHSVEVREKAVGMMKGMVQSMRLMEAEEVGKLFYPNTIDRKRVLLEMLKSDVMPSLNKRSVNFLGRYLKSKSLPWDMGELTEMALAGVSGRAFHATETFVKEFGLNRHVLKATIPKDKKEIGVWWYSLKQSIGNKQSFLWLDEVGCTRKEKWHILANALHFESHPLEFIEQCQIDINDLEVPFGEWLDDVKSNRLTGAPLARRTKACEVFDQSVHALEVWALGYKKTIKPKRVL